MALEDLTGTGKFINHLVETDPPQTDFRYEGAGHLRGVKNVLKNCFAAITGAVTATHTDLNKTVQLPTIAGGDAFKGIRVNAGETAYEFVADIGASTANITEYTATAGQTTFSGSDDHAVTLTYVAGYLQVYLNGVLLEPTTDYTATDGTSIVLTTGAAAGDVLQAFGFGTFDLADHYTKTAADARYAPIARSRKNLIINGCMRISQRGTTFPATAIAYTLDRWKVVNNTTGVLTTDVYTTGLIQPIPVSQYMYLNTTTALGSVSAGDLCTLRYAIEGYDMQHLMYGHQAGVPKNMTISFWHAHQRAGTYCVSFRNEASNRSYIAEYTQTVAGGFQKTTITVPGDTTGTWATGSGVGMYITFANVVGSTYHTATTDAWQTGNYMATSNQVNGMGATSDVFRITAIQLEMGDEATDFEMRPVQEELAMCQRYYEKSYNYYTAPPGATQLGMEWVYVAGLNVAVHGAGGKATFRVEKRAIPTITAYSPVTTTAGQAHDYTAASDSAVSVSSPNTSGFRWNAPTTSSANISIAVQWVADAELT